MIDVPMLPEWTTDCIAQHIGPWLIEPTWFAEAIAAVRAGTFPNIEAATQERTSQKRTPYTVMRDGIARISLRGHLMKGLSKFGGTSTVMTRVALRAAVSDADVRGIMLHIDSPGGTVAGTADLADEVQAANAKKPVHAYIEDLGASAAYWVASQTQRITAGRTARVGSIGTVAVIEDSSGEAEKAGVKVHVISTGDFKGAGTPGTEVTDEQLAYVQEMVDDLNGHFLQAVMQGRGMLSEDVQNVADGRVHIAIKAWAIGLIDEVGSFGDAVGALVRQVDESDATPRRDAADASIRISEVT